MIGGDKNRWECCAVLEGHERSVYSVSWGVGRSAEVEGRKMLGWVASTGGDGKINIWEISAENRTMHHTLLTSLDSAHGVADVNAVVWCPRSGYEHVLATAGDDYTCRVWCVVPTR